MSFVKNKVRLVYEQGKQTNKSNIKLMCIQLRSKAKVGIIIIELIFKITFLRPLYTFPKEPLLQQCHLYHVYAL